MTGDEAPQKPSLGSAVPRRHVVGLLLGGVVATVGAPALFRRGDGPAQNGSVASARTVLSRGRGTWTSTGSIAVLGLTRCGGEGHPGHADRTEHTDGTDGTTSPARKVHPRHQVWPDLVTIDVEVHNGLASAVLFSPGQLRLQVGPDGPTVTPLAAGFSAGPAAGGSTTMTWVSFLAPKSTAELRLQYSEPATRDVKVLALPAAGPHGRAS